MMGGDLPEYTIHQIGDDQRDELAGLARDFGEGLFDRDDRSKVDAACANHNGLSIKNAENRIVGSIFVERLERQLALGARPARLHPVTYPSRLVLAPSARHLGLGRFMVYGALCFEYGRTEGKFPDVVALAFADTGLTEKFEHWVGAVSFDKDDWANGCHASLHVVNEMAQLNKETRSIDRPHRTLILQPEKLPMIARQIRMAYDRGVQDHEHGTIVRMVDHSDGRSSIVREIEQLAMETEYALRRLGLSAESLRAG